jgi:hypothetical protein
MRSGSALRISVGIIAAVLVAAAAAQASTVFAPLAMALFIIAIVWPLQCWLQARMPKLPALAITIVVTLAAGLAFIECLGGDDDEIAGPYSVRRGDGMNRHRAIAACTFATQALGGHRLGVIGPERYRVNL